nr:unnamed protein product [Callosobruchus analis]
MNNSEASDGLTKKGNPRKRAPRRKKHEIKPKRQKNKEKHNIQPPVLKLAKRNALRKYPKTEEMSYTTQRSKVFI